MVRVRRHAAWRWRLAMTGLAGFAATACGQAEFIALDGLPGGTDLSLAVAVSADGGTVCGYGGSEDAGIGRYEAFVWTEQGGLRPLGFLPGGLTESQAAAVNADGSIIAGSGSSSRVFGDHLEGCLWISGQTPEGIGVIGEWPMASSPVTAMSGDGRFVVGNSAARVPSGGFLWTREEGFLLLEAAERDWITVAQAVTDDGAAIFGYASTAQGQRARVWRREDQWRVADLFEGIGAALACTSDGTVVTGRLGSGQSQELLRWTAPGGPEGLGNPAGTGSSVGWDVSDDGRVIVGTATWTGSGGDRAAILWVDGLGVEVLERYLADRFGLELPGWSLEVARGVSADGRVIAGWGTNPEGQTEAWVVRLPWLVCATDLTGDGRLDAADVLEFLDRFAGGEADWTGDGVTDTRDVVSYLGSWASGCE